MYWLGLGWWCLGLVRASLLCMSKICLLLMRSPWFGGSSAQFAVYPWLFMTWAIFWFPILLWLAPLGAGLYLIVGFSFISPLFCSFLQSYYHFLLNYSAIPVVMLLDPSLLGSFGLAAYSSLNDSVWSLGLLISLLVSSCVSLISFWTSLAHLFSLGILGPF